MCIVGLVVGEGFHAWHSNVEECHEPKEQRTEAPRNKGAKFEESIDNRGSFSVGARTSGRCFPRPLMPALATSAFHLELDIGFHTLHQVVVSWPSALGTEF